MPRKGSAKEGGIQRAKQISVLVVATRFLRRTVSPALDRQAGNEKSFG